MALALPMSYAKAYMECEVHTQHLKNKDAQQRIAEASVSRLDVLIKAFGQLARAIGRTRAR
jgi:hypothetical protein